MEGHPQGDRPRAPGAWAVWRPGAPHGGVLCLVLSGAVAGLACGGGDAERVREARTDLEEQFGRRPMAEPRRAGAADPETSASEMEPQTPVPAAADPGGSEGAPGGSENTPEETEVAPGGSEGRETTGSRDAPGVDVDSLLVVAEAAYDRLTSLRAGFVQRLEVPLLDRTSEGRGTWYQRGTGFFRMDFEDPPDDLYVADGTFLWLYEPSARPEQVVKSRLGTGAEARTVDILGHILSAARTNYTATHDGQEEVAGVMTHVVSLTPIGASRYRGVRVWIGTSDRLVRRFRIEEENESIRTVTLSQLQPQVSLADSLFQFTSPPGVQVFEG